MGTGKFLYAVIEKEGEASLPLTGLGDAPLEVFPCYDIAAVTSDVEMERFAKMEEESLKADISIHQQVNLRLMQYHTVVPMRFGIIAQDGEQVEELLRGVYVQLKALLTRLQGKAELVVQAFWDLARVLQESKERVGGEIIPDTGSVDPRRAVKIGRLLFAAAEARKKEFITAIHTRLSPLAEEFSEGPHTGDSTILNRSYLVAKEKEPLFDEAMNGLGAEYGEYLRFRYIGPMPAYSFANIELTRGNFALIDQARKTLALPEEVSPEEIKASYRRLALLFHPDRHPDDPQADERFKAIVRAHEVIQAYCQSYRSFLGKDTNWFSFAREDVERVFLVKERRGARAWNGV